MIDKKSIDEKFMQYRSLKNRADLERSTKESIMIGRVGMGMMHFEPTGWMVSVISFLKWLFNVTSAQEASELAQREGIEREVIEIFMNKR